MPRKLKAQLIYFPTWRVPRMVSRACQAIVERPPSQLGRSLRNLKWAVTLGMSRNGASQAEQDEAFRKFLAKVEVELRRDHGLDLHDLMREHVEPLSKRA